MRAMTTGVALCAGLVIVPVHAEASADPETAQLLATHGQSSEPAYMRNAVDTHATNRDIAGVEREAGVAPGAFANDYRGFGERSSSVTATASDGGTIAQQSLGKGTLTFKAATRPFLFEEGGGLSHQGDYADVPYSTSERLRRRHATLDFSASYSLYLSPRLGSLFGSMGWPGEPALGPSASYLRNFPYAEDGSSNHAGHWIDSANISSGAFTVGYAWRNLMLESSAFSARESEGRKTEQRMPRLDSVSRRLSVQPAPNWTFQLSRGQISTLDQLEPNGGVRRTTLSATYNRSFDKGDWRTTLAWGRNARKFQESNVGYLLESSFRLYRRHGFFGRIEQVSSDELLRENQSLQRQMFKMDKLTAGYLYEVQTGASNKFDIGALATKHRVPSEMSAIYGRERTFYMAFVRFQLP